MDKRTMEKVTSQLKCLVRWEFEFDPVNLVWRHNSNDLCAMWDMEMQVGSYVISDDDEIFLFLVRSWTELENIVENVLPDIY